MDIRCHFWIPTGCWMAKMNTTLYHLFYINCYHFFYRYMIKICRANFNFCQAFLGLVLVSPNKTESGERAAPRIKSLGFALACKFLYQSKANAPVALFAPFCMPIALTNPVVPQRGKRCNKSCTLACHAPKGQKGAKRATGALARAPSCPLGGTHGHAKRGKRGQKELPVH